MESTTQSQGTATTEAPVQPSQAQASGPATAEATPKPTRAKTKMAQSQAPLHPNPRVAKALAEHARQGDKYKSAAELCRAMGINDKNTQRTVRQVLRDAGLGVGRGRTYVNITAPKVVKAAQSNAKRAVTQAKQSAKA